MSQPPVIGLDLGMLNLRAALFRNNQIELIKDELGGSDSTPAFIGFNLQSDNPVDTILGRHAYDLAQRKLTYPVYGLKKLLGRKLDDPVITSERGHWSFDITSDQDGFAAVSIPTKSSSSKLYKPDELLSMLVRKVIERVDVRLGVPVKEAVVTVPACFGFVDRERIAQLCDAAGIKVKRMLNEAWVAAVACGFQKELKDVVNVLVINIGAGFVDISFITIDEMMYEVRASYGYPLTPDILDEYSSDNFESLQKHLTDIQCKVQLKVDQIWLSGGSSFLPELRRLFKDLFVGVTPVIITDPSTAVVRGAAIYAALLGGDKNKRLEDFIVLSATNFDLGIKVADGSIKTIVQQNFPCPAKATRQFTTSVNDQTTVVFEIYETGEQGEDVCREAVFLGEVVLSDLPPLPKGRLALDAVINVDASLCISVKVSYAKLNMEKRIIMSKVSSGY